MSPSAVTEPASRDPLSSKSPAVTKDDQKRTICLLDRHLHKDFPVVVSGKGNHLFTKDGRTVFDTTSGAAVSCLGHGNERVINAIHKQMTTGIPYLASSYWGSEIVDDLCKELIDGTDGKMAKVYLTGSGMSRKTSIYHVNPAQTCPRFRGNGSLSKACPTVLLRE
jgi:adenosylmethionine-8-amino-7-oxononanoate aminotransferase